MIRPELLLRYKWVIAWAAFSLLITGMAIVGGFRHFSAVPYWDMWGGTVQFYFNVMDGDSSVWWAQHNEHRPVLARLLFWIDFYFFDGLGIFLIVANYLLAALAALVFWLFLRDLQQEQAATEREIATGLLITAWLFLWCQSENFTWGFQSQFFMAQLLPLAALLWLARSIDKTPLSFALACLLGVLSAGAMANGVLALPLMLCCALLLRQSAQRCAILLGLSALVLGAYFYDYHAQESHGHLSVALQEMPADLWTYILRYLGSCFYYLYEQGNDGKLAAERSGLFLIIGSVLLGLYQLFSQKKSPAMLALLFFILYIGGTAVGTAGGRVIFGLDQAFSSRYTTPSLMAFAALLVAADPLLCRLKGKVWTAILLLLSITLCTHMFKLQVSALEVVDDQLAKRDMAGLAIALHIQDSVMIGNIYPDSAYVQDLVKKAVAGRYTIFARTPYLDLVDQFDKPWTIQNGIKCMGALDRIEAIDGDTNHIRVFGWLFNEEQDRTPRLIRFIDPSGKVAGFARTGIPRPDVAKVIDRRASYSGFGGYLRTRVADTEIIAVGDQPDCQLPLKVPTQLYHVSSQDPASTSDYSGMILAGTIMENSGWTGSDYYHSTFEKLQVLGTFIQSDVDKGSLSLRAHRGDRFYYRSGPTGGHQLMDINAGKIITPLPVSTSWTLIELSDQHLPDEFILKLIDDGSALGEWSAIALVKE